MNYQPYGEQWQREMAKFRKADAIKVCASALIRRQGQYDTLADRCKQIYTVYAGSDFEIAAAFIEMVHELLPPEVSRA